MIAIRFGTYRLVIFELLSIVIAVLLTFASDVFLPFALVLLVVISGFHLARRSALSVLLPNPKWAAIVLIVMLLTSLLVTPQPQITQPQISRMFLGILVCAAVMRSIHFIRCNTNAVSTRQSLLMIQYGFILLGFALALASPFIVDWEGASKFSFLPKGLYSIFSLKTNDSVNPNVMAGILVILSPLAAALFLYRKEIQTVLGKQFRDLLPSLSLLVSGLNFIVLLLMQSRGAMMGFICSITLLVLLKWRRWRIAVGIVLLSSLMLLISILFLRNSLMTLNGVLVSVLGLSQRIDIWSRGILLVQDFPLTGIGMGSFEFVTGRLYPLTLEYHEVPHAHNLFLQVAVDLGIPGLIAWLGILANVIIACITLIRSREPLLRAAGAGLLASNVALCVHGLTDAVTWGMVRTAPLVWALWGLALGASLLCQPPARKAQPPEPAP